MENLTTKIYEKKTENYDSNMNNFIVEGELTVTITLNEYRALTMSHATKKVDIDKANADKYERETKIRSLTEENEKLKAENYELKKQAEKVVDKGEKDATN